MNGSDIYQKNERNRQEFKKIRAAAAAAEQRKQGGGQADIINLPFFIGMGLGLGLNIVGYFAFKAYFRSFLQSFNSRPRSGAPYGVNRSDFEGVNRYKQQRQKQHQYYYQHHNGTDADTGASSSKHSQQWSQSSPSSSARKQQQQQRQQQQQKQRDDRASMIRKHLLRLDMPLSTLNPSVADIKKAYRAISLKTHPDVNVVQASSRNSNSSRDGASAGADTGEDQRKVVKALEQRFMHATVAHDELLRQLHGK